MVARRSRAIGRKAAQTIYYAVGEQAERIGSALTHHVTINFSLTDIDPAIAPEVFCRLRRNFFDKWARRPRKQSGRAFVPAFAYVFENARDGIAFEEIGPGLPHNVHVHWAVHLPAERVHDFGMRIYQWLDRFCGTPCEAGAVKITNITRPKGLRGYVLTGTEKKWASRYGAAHEAQGLIIGKRCGTSVNLGRSARMALDRQTGVRRRAA